MDKHICLSDMELGLYQTGHYEGPAFPHPDYWVYSPECHRWHPFYRNERIDAQKDDREQAPQLRYAQ